MMATQRVLPAPAAPVALLPAPITTEDITYMGQFDDWAETDATFMAGQIGTPAQPAPTGVLGRPVAEVTILPTVPLAAPAVPANDGILIDTDDSWLLATEHGPDNKWEHMLPVIKNKGYGGASIRKRILATLSGADEGFCVHQRRELEDSHTDSVFFNTNSIKIHHTVYAHNKRHGGVYKRKESYIIKIYFEPKVRILRAFNGRIIEESYNSMHKLDGLVAKYVRLYLKHFGHRATTLKDAVLPVLGRTIRLGENELYKKHWRQPSIKATLKAAKLPHSKSMVRAFNAVTSVSLWNKPSAWLDMKPEPLTTVATLTYLRVLWYICKDVNILAGAVYKGQSIEICGKYSPLSVRALNSMLKPFTKKERVALAQYVIGGVRVRAKHKGVINRRRMMVADVFRMAKTIYEEYGVVNVTCRAGEELHHELSRICTLIRNPELDQTIKYTDEEAKIDNHELINGYVMHLPIKGTDVVDMGTTLHNCLSGYAGTAVRRKCTIIAIHKDGKLYAAGEVARNRLVQVSTFSNGAIDKGVRTSMERSLQQLNIIK